MVCVVGVEEILWLCAEDRTGHRHLMVGGFGFGKPKVGQLGDTISRQQHVRRLDITVNDALVVALT